MRHLSHSMQAVCMKRLTAMTALTIAIAGAPVAAMTSPYAVAERMCSMVNGGLSRSQAWNYIVDEYTKGSMQGWSQTWGQPRMGSFGGGAIGYGLASGIRIGMELRSMRSEVFGLTASMCGGGPSRIETVVAPVTKPSDTDSSKTQTAKPAVEGCTGPAILCEMP